MMLIYIIVLLIPIIFGIILIKKSKRKKTIYLLLTFSVFVLVSGLRSYSVGTDTLGYYDIFNRLGTFGIEQFRQTYNIEIGYIYLNLGIHNLFGNFQILLFVIAIIINFSFARLIYKHSDNVVLSTFIYAAFIFPRTLNIMRQYLAIALIIIALEMLIERKLMWFLLLIVVASLFHVSALIFLPFCIIRHFKGYYF